MEPPQVPCPVCGASKFDSASALLAVCDVLVIKALENLGKKIVRYRAAEEAAQDTSVRWAEGRSRNRLLGKRPWYVAHTIFRPSDEDVCRALKDAWDVVTPLWQTYGCCEVTPQQVTEMLDEYVHDLAITSTTHHIMELAYRFRSRLGLPVYLHQFTSLDPTEPLRTRITVTAVR